jgi:hypothetical protein
MTIHKKLKAAGCELDTYQSDLYVKASDESRAVLAGYEFRQNVERFTCPAGDSWYDIPFANDDFWNRVENCGASVSKAVACQAARRAEIATPK